MFGQRNYLRFVLQASERVGKNDPVEIYFKFAACFIVERMGFNFVFLI
jgi:hypothetical protein